MPSLPPLSPTGVNRRPRRIKPGDSATTVPGRITFPVGTYTAPASNPATAGDGSLGGPSGMQPPKPQQLFQGFLNSVVAPAVQPLIPRVPFVNNQPTPAATVRTVTPTSGSTPYGPARPPLPSGPPAGYGGNFPTTSPVLSPNEDRYAQRTAETIRWMGETGNLPSSLDSATLGYLRNSGKDPSALAQFYTFDAKTGTYVINEQGRQNNALSAAGAAGALQPGQFMDPTTGEVRRGATPFGTNAAGQRLDASGGVWDPKTAKTDIYGGRFIQVGEVRWERNSKGRLVKVQYGKGGTKKIVQGGGSGKKKKKAPSSSSAPAAETEPRIGEASVNLNVAAG